MKVTEKIRSVGVFDPTLTLFERQYPVRGMAYNSYVILDDKIAVLDTVDAHVGGEWQKQLDLALDGRAPDYLIVQHMEPDHSANIAAFLSRYPGAAVVASTQAFVMMRQFFGTDYSDRRLVVGDGDTLTLGTHTLHFLTAPMVHWPEVIVTYDDCDRVLFSADAFGAFGAPERSADWTDEARRYYIGIVGKYGAQVQALLKKAAAVEIRTICPLHGPVLDGGLSDCLELYRKWSTYTPEEPGVCIAFTSVYGNTRRAAELLAEHLRADGTTVALHDLTAENKSFAIADAFRYDRLVLATTTYNGDVFPAMRAFLSGLTERSFRARRVGLIENGTWAPVAAKVMRGMLEPCRDLSFADTAVRIRSALNEESRAQLDALAAEMR